MAPIEKQPSKPPNCVPIQTNTPEPASINAILRKHCRTRLFVNPLQWTSTHLNLLGCHFEHTDMATPPAHQHPQPTSSRLRRLERHLFPPRPTRESKTLILREIFHLHGMSPYNMPPPWRTATQTPLPFSFARAPAGRIVTRGVYCAPVSTSPSVAYLDFERVDMYRDRSVRCAVSPLFEYNRITMNLRRSRLSRLRPADPLEHPYVAATMIALAQAQRQRQASGQDEDEDEPTHWVTHVVALVSGALYFYTASVPTRFLDRFDEPSRGVEACSLRIEYGGCNSGERLWRAFEIMTGAQRGTA